MMLKIYIENELIDLFETETIELNSSVANTEDISKINTDYTKTFTVPASDRNNRIFKNYYNADIDNTFDARTKKDARIELDGFPFRTGKMRLEKVQVKSGQPTAYTINFWGNLVSVKTLIKDDELTSLDLSAYNHTYNYSNVANGLENGLFGKDIIYTLMSQNKQYMYSSDPSDNTNTDKLVNIAYNGEDRGVLWSDLKPSIRLTSIIEAIEQKYGFNFSDDFFGREEFVNLYMWLNNTEGTLFTEQEINWTAGSATDFGLNLGTNEWVVNSYSSISPTITNMLYRIQVNADTGFEGVPYKIIVKNNGVVYQTVEATGDFTMDFAQAPDTPFNVKFYVASSANFDYSASLLIRAQSSLGSIDRSATSPISSIIDTFDVSPALPKMKTIDFLKGLFNMFKLVAIPDEKGNIYVNTIDDYYLEGNIYDITKYIDFETYDVERSKIFSTINYKFQSPTTILNMQFEKNTGIAYGDELLSLADDNGEPLDGDTLEITLPFEQVLYERLTDLFTNVKSNVQYGLITDESIEPANPKAVIFYNNIVSLGTSPISVLNSSNNSVEFDETINTPSHTLGFSSPNFSVLWGVEFSTWNSVAIQNTLFGNYWDNYISSIFNIKRRNFKFKAVLPVSLLTKLSLNDVLFIKDRYYRINDFTVDLTTRGATLNLMNTFENNFGIFAPSQSRIFLNSFGQTYGVYVSNAGTMTFTKIDGGFGTSWATVTQSGKNIIITVPSNTTGIERDMNIEVENETGKTFTLYLNQQA
jgi:hypothetical protein